MLYGHSILVRVVYPIGRVCRFVDFAHLGFCYLTRFGLVSLSVRRSVPAGLLFRYRWTIGVVFFYPSVRCLDSTFFAPTKTKRAFARDSSAMLFVLFPAVSVLKLLSTLRRIYLYVSLYIDL